MASTLWNLKQIAKHVALWSPGGSFATRYLASIPLRVLAGREDFETEFDGEVLRAHHRGTTGLPLFWNYEPTMRYDRFRFAWEATIDGTRVYLDQLPAYELLNEFRGYTMLGKPREDTIAIDVGGSMGVSSFVLGALCPKGKVLLLEPDPRCAGAIRRKFKLNPRAPVTWVPKGVGSRPGKVRFVSQTGGTSHFEYAEDESTASSDFVQVTTLKDLVAQYQLPRIDMIKMDIEGMETEIKEDISWAIAQNPACVAAIASYHRQSSGSRSAEILETYVSTQPHLFAKTIYSLHPTTMVVHRDNSDAVSKLTQIPRATFA